MSETAESIRHILVIEDDEAILDACEMLLQYNGFTVTTRTSPLNIHQHLQDIIPDCLLMDVSMPPYNGCDVCRALKDQGCVFPVLLFSADVISNVALKQCGADAFVSKPFSSKLMIDTIRRLLCKSINEE